VSPTTGVKKIDDGYSSFEPLVRYWPTNCGIPADVVVVAEL